MSMSGTIESQFNDTKTPHENINSSRSKLHTILIMTWKPNWPIKSWCCHDKSIGQQKHKKDHKIMLSTFYKQGIFLWANSIDFLTPNHNRSSVAPPVQGRILIMHIPSVEVPTTQTYHVKSLCMACSKQRLPN